MHKSRLLRWAASVLVAALAGTALTVVVASPALAATRIITISATAEMIDYDWPDPDDTCNRGGSIRASLNDGATFNLYGIGTSTLGQGFVCDEVSVCWDSPAGVTGGSLSSTGALTVNLRVSSHEA
jgi:hypothetical protein